MKRERKLTTGRLHLHRLLVCALGCVRNQLFLPCWRRYGMLKERRNRVYTNQQDIAKQKKDYAVAKQK